MSDGGGGMSGAADAAANFRAPHHGGGGGGGGTSGAASGPSDGASGGVKKPYLFTRELTGSWENKYGFPVHKRDLDALVDMTTDGWTLLCDENGFKKDNLTVQLQYYAEPTRKTLLRISGFNKFVKSLPQNKVKGAVEFGLKATEAKQLIFYRLSEDGGDGGGVASNNAAALPIIPAPAPQKLPPKYQWKLRNANVHSDSSKQVALEDEAPAKAERGKQIRTRAQAKHVAPEDEAEQDKAPTKQRGKHVQGSIRIRTRAQAPAKQVVQRGKHVQGSIRIRTRAQKAMLDREDRDVALNHLQGAIDLLARLVEFKEQIKTKDELDLLLASLKSGMDWSPEVAMDMLRKTEGRDLLVILEKKKEKMVVEAEREQDEESLAQPSVIQQAVAQQVLNVAKVIEEQLDDEISKLERLDDDDLMQMKQMAAKRQQWMAQGHGEYQEILSEKDFFAAAKASDRVVCHFYRENWPCKVMDKHLNILSKQHLETRFVKINAEKSPFLTERLKIVMLPTLALIKNVMLPTLALIKKGKVDDYVVGFDELGGTDEFSTEELEERLARSKIIMADGQSAGDRSKATTTATATSKADTSAKAKHVAPEDEAEAPAKQVVQRGKHVQGSIRIRTRAQKAMLDREDRDVALNHLQGAIDLLARLVEFKEQIKTKDELDLLLASLKSGMDWSPEVAMDMLRKTEGRDLLVILEKKKEKMVVEAEREQDEESLAQPSVIQQAVAQQVLNVAKVIEEQLDDEISKLERLDDDDLMQMKQMAAKRQQWMAQGHGEYQEILSEKDFFAAAKASDRVVCHFYRENWPCKVMDKHLNILSKQHLETRFVKINAEKSPFLTERLKILMLPTLALIKNVMLPTLALIKKGKVDDYVVGFDELGGTDEFSTEELEERLARSKIIMADGQSAGDRSKATTTATATSKADTSAKNAKADEEYVRVHLSVGAPPC